MKKVLACVALCVLSALLMSVVPTKADSTTIVNAYASTLSFCQSKEQFVRHTENISTKRLTISLDNVPMTDEEKALYIYGDKAFADRNLRRSQELLFDKSSVVSVEIPIWKLENGTKVPSKAWITVRPELEEIAKAIFTEIYEGPEKFPIKEVGGARKTDSYKYSEHLVGQAIDINPYWNPEMNLRNGVFISSNPSGWPKWDHSSPYCIEPDGDVVTAFKRYGFLWGGDWGRKKDYMHFSYFGG